MNEDIEQSRQFEMRVYVDSMKNMYENSLLSNGEIFDMALTATQQFTEISPEAIINDSRIIKILRYSTAPSISQMKFGQLFGLSTIEAFEKAKIVSGTKLAVLKRLAPEIAAFVNNNLDSRRYLWLSEQLSEEGRILALEYAKHWTCSLIADQNAQTEYRNWRKVRQEAAVEQFLINAGYIRSSYSGEVRQNTDIGIGEYSKERKVRGRTSQKADLVVRRKKDGGLIVIEAKAVGVLLDAFKRVKECCDKSRDWHQNNKLGDLTILAVIAGFFSETNLDALAGAGVSVVWEHRLEDLQRHI